MAAVSLQRECELTLSTNLKLVENRLTLFFHDNVTDFPVISTRPEKAKWISSRAKEIEAGTGRALILDICTLVAHYCYPCPTCNIASFPYLRDIMSIDLERRKKSGSTLQHVTVQDLPAEMPLETALVVHHEREVQTDARGIVRSFFHHSLIIDWEATDGVTFLIYRQYLTGSDHMNCKGDIGQSKYNRMDSFTSVDGSYYSTHQNFLLVPIVGGRIDVSGMTMLQLMTFEIPKDFSLEFPLPHNITKQMLIQHVQRIPLSQFEPIVARSSDRQRAFEQQCRDLHARGKYCSNT